jgi:hypothetical protein
MALCNKTHRSSSHLCLLLVFLLLSLAGCGANQEILKSGKGSPTPGAAEPTRNTIDRDLQEFRNADFNYIYVIRRKDGGAMDAEDRKVIKQQTEGANRRVSADDDKAFIIGTNPLLLPQNMAALNARFIVEDHSPPPAPAANTDSNSNKPK